MNFYEHRLRDYDAATAHLTWDEDMAYSRLIRWYYRKERPIPADVKEACRQVRATTKAQRDAVQAVLDEFFELREDGWHKDDCDELIAQYLAGEPEREAKKKNEDTRLARHRAERAHLFAIINAAGMHLPYNAPISEVRALAARLQSPDPATPKGTDPATPATPPATAPATPATATQSPVPTTHYPKEEEQGRAQPPEAESRAGPETPETPTVAGAICLAMRAVGYPATASHDPVFRALIDQGATRDEFVEAARAALADGIVKSWGWVLARVRNRRAEASGVALAQAPPAPSTKPRRTSAVDRQIATMNALTGKDRSHGPDHAADPADTIDVAARVVP